MEVMDYFNKNKQKWKSELILLWEKDTYTDCCLDEWYAYKMWIYSQGEDYFNAMKLYLETAGDEQDINKEDMKRDAWKVYLNDLGVDNQPFGLQLNSKLQKQEKSNKPIGGIA